MKPTIKRKSITISMPLAFMLVIGILVSSCQKKIDQLTEYEIVKNNPDYFKVSQEQFQQHKNFLAIVNTMNQKLRNDKNLDKQLETALMHVSNQQISLETISINNNVDSVYIHIPSFILYIDVLDSLDYLVQTLVQYDINGTTPSSISVEWQEFKNELGIEIQRENVKYKKSNWCCVVMDGYDSWDVPCKQYTNVSEWWAEAKCSARGALYLTLWTIVSEGSCNNQDLCP